jgi:hypothetical protein
VSSNSDLLPWWRRLAKLLDREKKVEGESGGRAVQTTVPSKVRRIEFLWDWMDSRMRHDKAVAGTKSSERCATRNSTAFVVRVFLFWGYDTIVASKEGNLLEETEEIHSPTRLVRSSDDHGLDRAAASTQWRPRPADPPVLCGRCHSHGDGPLDAGTRLAVSTGLVGHGLVDGYDQYSGNDPVATREGFRNEYDNYESY